MVSCDDEQYLLKEIKDFGLENIFADIYTDVYDKKIVLNELIDKHDLDKNQTLFIGDTDSEIKDGKANGLKTAGVTWGIHSESRLRAANADHVIHNLDELKNIIL